MMRWMVKDEAALCLVMRQTATADPRVSGQLMYEIATSDVRPRLSEIAVPVTVSAHAFSASAKQKIEAAGGSATTL